MCFTCLMFTFLTDAADDRASSGDYYLEFQSNRKKKMRDEKNGKKEKSTDHQIMKCVKSRVCHEKRRRWTWFCSTDISCMNLKGALSLPFDKRFKCFHGVDIFLWVAEKKERSDHVLGSRNSSSTLHHSYSSCIAFFFYPSNVWSESDKC